MSPKSPNRTWPGPWNGQLATSLSMGVGEMPRDLALAGRGSTRPPAWPPEAEGMESE